MWAAKDIKSLVERKGRLPLCDASCPPITAEDNYREMPGRLQSQLREQDLVTMISNGVAIANGSRVRFAECNNKALNALDGSPRK